MQGYFSQQAALSQFYVHETFDSLFAYRRYTVFMYCLQCFELPSMLCHCWLGFRKSIRPVKNWVMSCWRGYLSLVRCKWSAYGPADATATPSSVASLKSRLVWPTWWWLTQFVVQNRPLNGCT